MNYEKKYKEALERAEAELKTAEQFDYDDQQTAHVMRVTTVSIFPELKESEDERVRKQILSYIRNSCSSATRNDKEEWIAWLEKQKPVEWSEICEEHLRTRFAFYTYKDEDDALYLSNLFVEESSRNKGFGTKILKAAEKVAETIGATSIRLKVKQSSPANEWYRKHGYGYMAFEDGYDWLEKRLEYLKPPEWSKEDETMRQNLVGWLKGNFGLLPGGVERYIDWLTDRLVKLVYPKPHWSPSEEQNESTGQDLHC